LGNTDFPVVGGYIALQAFIPQFLWQGIFWNVCHFIRIYLPSHWYFSVTQTMPQFLQLCDCFVYSSHSVPKKGFGPGLDKSVSTWSFTWLQILCNGTPYFLCALLMKIPPCCTVLMALTNPSLYNSSPSKSWTLIKYNSEKMFSMPVN
jgi:hypothetical protein